MLLGDGGGGKELVLAAVPLCIFYLLFLPLPSLEQLYFTGSNSCFLEELYESCIPKNLSCSSSLYFALESTAPVPERMTSANLPN